MTTLNAPGLTGTAGERALQHALGVTHVAGANASGGTVPLVTALSPAVPSAKATATYHGEFDVDILHFEEAAALPLRSGATFEDGSFRLVIDDVQSPDRGPVLRVMVSRASASLDRRSPATFTTFSAIGARVKLTPAICRPGDRRPSPGPSQ